MSSRPVPPSVLITGRPVVILEESLLARALGRGEKTNPFNFKPTVNPFLEPTILRPILRHSLYSDEANNSLITYQPEAVRNSAADCARQQCTSLLRLPVPPPQMESDTSIASTEDAHVVPYNGGRHCLEVACRLGVPPYGASQFASLPTITLLDDVTEEETFQEKFPSEDEHTFTLQDNQTEKEPDIQLETKTILHTPDTAQQSQHCLQEETISPKVPNLTEDDCDHNHQKMNDSVTSQQSIGERILKAWTDGIVTMSAKPNAELREKHKATTISPKSSRKSAAALLSISVESSTESQADDDSGTNSMTTGDFPIPKGNLPPLLLQPSRAVFAFEEREEHLLQDSDSELEMLPEHGSQLSLSDSCTHISLEENEPPKKKKAPEKSVIVDDTPPPPPPPPPPPSSFPNFQKRFLKATMLSSSTNTAPEVGLSTKKFGNGFDLHNLFGSQAVPIQSVRPLPLVNFDPLTPLKLTPSLKLGLQKNTQTPLQPNNTANGTKNTSNEESNHGQSSEPPSKKTKLLESDAAAVEGGVASEHGTHATAEDFTNPNEMYFPPEISQVAKGPPSFIETLSPINSPKENPPLEAVVPVLSSPEAKQNHATSCHLFEQGQLEYPHEPSDNADDGLDTTYQAVPTECAREHALVANMVPCRNEVGDTVDRRDHHDDTDGEHSIEVPVEQQIVSLNSHSFQLNQSSEHLLDDRQTTISEVPCLEKQKLLLEQHSTPELNQPLKPTEVESNPPQGHSVPTCVNEYSTHSPLMVDHHQLVPEDSLNSSFITHSLYDHTEPVKEEQKSDFQGYESLKDVDIDELDGPTVLSMALESIEARHKNVRFEIESPEQVSPEVPMHQWSSAYGVCQPNSIRTASRYQHGKYIQVCSLEDHMHNMASSYNYEYLNSQRNSKVRMSPFFFSSLQILNPRLSRPHA